MAPVVNLKPDQFLAALTTNLGSDKAFSTKKDVTDAKNVIITDISTAITKAKNAIITDTGNTETALITAISNGISTAQSTLSTAISGNSSAISGAESTIIKNTDADFSTLSTAISGNGSAIFGAESRIIKNAEADFYTLSTAISGNSSAISGAESRIIKNTDADFSTLSNDFSALSTDFSALSTAISSNEIKLSSAISGAESTIIADEKTHFSILSTAIVKNADDINNLKTTLGKTVSEFGSQNKTITNIRDTHKNINILLNSAVHTKINSIGLISGDTLELTSARFQKLLDAEAIAGGVLFSGKIVIENVTLNGSYNVIISQFVDYRLRLNPGFNASEFIVNVSGSLTNEQRQNLKDLGLTINAFA